MSLAAFAVFAALCVAPVSPQGASVPAKSVNKAAAVRSLEKAAGYLAAADWTSAQFEARLGVTYDPTLADFPYVEALALAAINAPRADILERVERSLADGLIWRSYDRDEAAVLCARLYAETRRCRDALALLSTLKKHSSADEDYVRVVSLYGLSRVKEARAAVSAGLSRWPFDSRFPRVFLEREAGNPADPESVAIASSVVSRLYLWQDEDRRLLLLSVPFETDPAARERDIRVYRNMGMRDVTGQVSVPDPSSAAVALEYGVIGEKEALDEAFSLSETGIDIATLRSLSRLIGLDGVRKDMAARLRSYDGVIVDDSNNDGIMDSYARYRLGRPVLAGFDLNQDGYPDLTVSCELGAPTKITCAKDGPVVVYDTYPFVRTVTDGDREYTAMPLKFGWAPLGWKLEDLSLPDVEFYTVFATGAEPPLTERLLVNISAFYLQRDPRRSDGTSRVVLENGIPVSAESYARGVKYSWTSYAKGFPTMTREDRDGDGYFETTTSYRSGGKIDSVLVDRNGNRAVEYRERTLADGTVRQEWDADENGVFEISYATDGKGKATTVWLHPDSGLPVTCVTEDGKPRSVEYSGRVVPVIKDPFYDIWWVRRIPSNSRDIVKILDGVFNRGDTSVVSYLIPIGGKRLQAVRTGGILFAEQLDE